VPRRFERLTLSHWSAQAVAQTFSVNGEAAADLVVRTGSYSGAFPMREDVPRWSAYVRDTILDPAIGRDILALASVRRPALLRQVFGVAASSPAQIVSLQKLRGAAEVEAVVPPVFAYWREFAGRFLTAPCARSDPDERQLELPPPPEGIKGTAAAAPVMPGSEY
jgi:predicted AAA+ superfamily ATPase